MLFFVSAAGSPLLYVLLVAYFQKCESDMFDDSKLRWAGASFSIFINVAIIVLTVLAYRYSEDLSISMVVDSPTRYSFILVPFSFAAITAAALSFIPYFTLPTYLRILPLAGAVVAGVAIALLTVFDIPREADKLVDAYVRRLDDISWAIFAFATIAMVCSALKFRQVRQASPDSFENTPENHPRFWILKALVCDLPIVLGAIIIIGVQYISTDAAHQNFVNIYVMLLKAAGADLSSRPETFSLGVVNRELAATNFWIGVSLGVTSVQLVMQQVSTLMLEIVFWMRQN